MLKIVYFDEQSASDYLDITAGGKITSTSEDVKKRALDLQAKIQTKIEAKLSWLPFVGASAESSGGIDASRSGQSILSKTLSNTILTDYLAAVDKDGRVRRLTGMRVTAPRDSMAFMKMYTPYMVIAKTEDQGVDLARLDEALEGAKGYYELLAETEKNEKCILRFNIKAFRNNYGLTDLGRMRLVFHGILVGQSDEGSLSIQAEMSQSHDREPTTISALELLDEPATAGEGSYIDVYDVLLAGVEHDS